MDSPGRNCWHPAVHNGAILGENSLTNIAQHLAIRRRICVDGWISCCGISALQAWSVWGELSVFYDLSVCRLEV